MGSNPALAWLDAVVPALLLELGRREGKSKRQPHFISLTYHIGRRVTRSAEEVRAGATRQEASSDAAKEDRMDAQSLIASAPSATATASSGRRLLPGFTFVGVFAPRLSPKPSSTALVLLLRGLVPASQREPTYITSPHHRITTSPEGSSTCGWPTRDPEDNAVLEETTERGSRAGFPLSEFVLNRAAPLSAAHDSKSPYTGRQLRRIRLDVGKIGSGMVPQRERSEGYLEVSLRERLRLWPATWRVAQDTEYSPTHKMPILPILKHKMY
ncbi:hypothetical protein TARUN_903 [Trichoderma arundinaceum]|uniref:Uncharacterized protein n=1 Tax=Trichoderma arundinaceum TaxID=490622 RepID=A0A395NZ54_TRIAR|nr:hypothetical protein TARUN_903 [Trichoderma arundinaceum]